MKVNLKVLKTNLEIINNCELQDASVRHVELDKIIVSHPHLEFEVFHRNLIFEEDGIRVSGFILIDGVMGKAEFTLSTEQ
jgi:hypothetical protein